MRPRRNVRKERDDKVHDSIIEERIQRERPCRTLFIRNIKASDLRCAVLVCKVHKSCAEADVMLNLVRNK